MECMEKVNNMGLLELYHNSCQYLSKRLVLTIQVAQQCKSCSNSSLGLIQWCYGIFKVLLQLAKEVESFTQACCNDQWIRHAIMSTSVSEFVSLVGDELDICREILHDFWDGKSYPLRFLNTFRRGEAKLPLHCVNLDRHKLLENLKALIHLSKPSTHECQLATYLVGRLTADLTLCIPHSLESFSSSFWDVDFGSLYQLEKLGGGSIGFVHKTLWLGIQCVEKTFFGSNHPSFTNEVSILAGLSHPNIVPLFCYAMDNRQCSILMELMEGDLFHLMQTRMRRDKTLDCPFTLPEAMDIMLQIADGMDYLHRNKVVHRDLKSHNILVKIIKDEDEEYVYVKVSDFGLSKTKEMSNTFSNQTMNTSTTRWMAPELMDPQMGCNQGTMSLTSNDMKKYPFKSDVYSFGMVCYEILTGEVPFQTTSSHSEVKSMVLDGWRPNL